VLFQLQVEEQQVSAAHYNPALFYYFYGVRVAVAVDRKALSRPATETTRIVGRHA